MPSYYSVPNQLIRLLDGFEQRGRIRQIAGGRDRAKLDELAEGELGVVEAGFYDLGVDLPELLEVPALGEQRQRWVCLEELVRWIGRREDMEVERRNRGSDW